MLEKKLGCIVVQKLSTMLLMKADFNYVNRGILGVRMIGQAEHLKQLLEQQAIEDKKVKHDSNSVLQDFI